MRPIHIVYLTVCFLASSSPVFASENTRSGDWLLVNGLVVLQVADDGTMTLRNTGMSGKLTIADDGSFVWEIVDQPSTKGRFESDRLLLQNMQPGTPKWIHMLEFKRADKDTASEVIEVALRQQTSALTAMAKVRENAIRMAVLNNLRQLAAAADQHFLENGTSKATYEQLVGADKYIRKLEPADGEDYSKLDLNQSNSELKVITSSGVIVTYER
jgi:hypothetical protein